ncbi:hypothetical protein ACFL2V_09610 [Pseudomonadota bacterium]
MNTSNNLKKVALILFIVIGLTHIISGLMMSNNYFPALTITLNRVLDIPFAMTGLIYAFVLIHEGIAEEKKKLASIGFIVITVIILLVLLYLNFLVPDKPPIINV